MSTLFPLGTAPSQKDELGRYLITAAAILVPAFSVTAAYLNSRELLIIMFMVIGLSPILVLCRPNSTGEVPIIVLLWSLGLSLLLSTTFLSDAVSGLDIHGEIFVYQQVLNLGFWNPTGGAFPQFNSVLSISILPTIITLVSGLDGVKVFEIALPLIFSLVPPVLYKIFRKLVDTDGAFLSVFLFVSYPTFYWELTGLGRQEVGELLLALLMWRLISVKLRRKISEQLALALLLVGFVTAHYSLAFIVLPILAMSYFAGQLSGRRVTTSSVTLFLIALVMGVGWYAYVGGGAALTSLAQTISSVIGGVTTNSTSQSSTPNVIQQAAGLQGILPGPLHQVSRYVQVLVQFCLGLGVLALLLKKGKSVTERRMLPIMVGAFLFLGASLFLPFLASALQLTRIYHITLLFIAPCFIYGIQFIESAFGRLSLLFRKPSVRSEQRFRRASIKSIVAVTLLISYFFFVSGWVWAVTSDRPDSIVLDMQRFRQSSDVQLQYAYYAHFTLHSDIAGARWLNLYDTTGGSVCSDFISRSHVLTSYAAFPPTRPATYLEFLPDCASQASYVYMSEFNTLSGGGYGYFGGTNSFLASGLNLGTRNLIYSNGGTAIYGQSMASRSGT